MADYTAVLPIIIVAGIAILIPGIRALSKSDRVTGAAALIGLGISMFLVLQFLWEGTAPITFAGVIQLNAFSALFMLVFLSVGAYVVISSVGFVKGEKHTGEFFALVLLAISGMMVVAGSLDLITLFIGIELTSLSSYALVAFRKKDKRGAEAATKYFIYGGLSSAIALFGISLLYGITSAFVDSGGLPAGTNPLLFTSIGAAVSAAQVTADPILFLATVMIIAGFGFKIALVPFHMWAPDVYEGSPTTITAMLAAGSKKMGFVAYFKIFLIGLLAIKADWTVLIAVIAILTMTMGNLIAVSQTNIKRMLAYSSIAQAGYILIALPIATVGDPATIAGFAGITIGEYGLAGGLFQIVTHAFMKGGAFLIVAALSTVAIGESIADYKGLSKRAPLMAFAMAVMLFSLAGIPPLAGFASKFVLFSGPVYASQTAGNGWMIWLAVAGILNSALSLYYYARVVKYMYVEKGPTDRVKVPLSMAVGVAICFLAVVIIGLYPQPVIDACLNAARALLGA
jgi:NADH-quinone oxidoreductase subunit N